MPEETPETTKTTGQAALKFGTKDFNHTTYGTCTDITFEPNAEKKERKDGENNLVGITFTDIATRVSANYEPLAGAAITEDNLEDLIGAEVTIGTKTYIIDEMPQLKYKKGEDVVFSFKARTIPNMPAPAAPPAG